MLRKSAISLLFTLLLAACGDAGLTGSLGSSQVVPRVNSTFIYDYEQTIIPVKPEDEDTTYRFEMTAKVVRDQVLAPGLENCIDVNMYDMRGIDVGTMMYRIAHDQDGDVRIIQPQFTNEWVKLPTLSHSDIIGPDSTSGDPRTLWREYRQKSSYLGMKNVVVGNETFECEKIRREKWTTEADQYSTRFGNCHETWTYWYSRELGFFVQRESFIDSDKLHSIRWKYSTREKLKSYNIVQ
jgi:hypothetical protein